MTRKRLLEVVGSVALLVALAGAGCGFLYVKYLNDAFAAALARGDSEAAFALLRKGANVRVAPREGRQALFLAALSGNPAFVELALDRGADVNIRRSDGHTPLMAATMRQGPHQAKGHPHPR